MKSLGMKVGILALVAGTGCGSSSDKGQATTDGGPETLGMTGNGGNAGSGGTSSSGGASALGGALGSGGTVGAGGAAGGASGASGAGGTAPTGMPFVPDIPVNYVGNGPSGGLAIVALTLVQVGEYGNPTVYVAVKNTGGQPICIVDTPMSFLDASGTELASSIGAGSLSSPMYNSFGSPTACIGDGDIGMGTITLGISSLDVSKVRKIEHGFLGNIDPAATKLTSVVATGIKVEPATSTSARVSGTVTNNGSLTIKNPEIHVFPVDASGRPYGDLTQLDLITVPAGGTWNFTTTSFTGQIQDTVAYVNYDSP